MKRRKSTSAADAGSPVTNITVAEAKEYLLRHLHLKNDSEFSQDLDGARALLNSLRCVQIDPLFPSGATNHELVFQARIEITREEVYDAIRGHCFEHWAKQRCFLPREVFSNYYHESRNGKSPKISWWRQEERRKLVGEDKIRLVLDKVRSSGKNPVNYLNLPQFGTVTKDWVEDASPSNLTNMALEILWGEVDIAITGREASMLRTKKKIYVASEHAFPDEIAKKPSETPFLDFLLLERVKAAGLLPLSSAPAMWSLIEETRGDTVDRLVATGLIEKVTIGDKPRCYLAPAGFRQTLLTPSVEFDDRVRILGPLDPIIWDRDLVKHLWAFEYKWEVYTPKNKRVWGYYVKPLLYKGEFIGRIELKSESAKNLHLIGLWLHDEASEAVKSGVFEAIRRHARLNQLELSSKVTPALAVSDAPETPKPKRKTTMPRPAKRKRAEDDEDDDDESEASDDSFVEVKGKKPTRSKKQKVADEDDYSDGEASKIKIPVSPGKTRWKSV